MVLVVGQYSYQVTVDVAFSVRHIKQTDGFMGLYRGLVPRLISTYVNGMVSAAVADVCGLCFASVFIIIRAEI